MLIKLPLVALVVILGLKFNPWGKKQQSEQDEAGKPPVVSEYASEGTHRDKELTSGIPDSMGETRPETQQAQSSSWPTELETSDVPFAMKEWVSLRGLNVEERHLLIQDTIDTLLHQIQEENLPFYENRSVRVLDAKDR